MIENPPAWANRVSRGTWTDLAVLLIEGTEITEHDDHLVIRSPERPEYYWGNYIQVLDPAATDDAERWLALFEQQFPDAPHRTFGLASEPGPVWAKHGFTADPEVTLLATRLPDQRPLPDNYRVAPLTSDDDWEAYVGLHTIMNDERGHYDPASYHEHAVRGARARRQMCDDGVAGFWGAWDGDELASFLGMVALADTGRYQSVTTRADHRRRGLAGHLLGVAAQWAWGRGCRTLVIRTETDNPAGRLYRSLGFDGTEVDFGVERAPRA